MDNNISGFGLTLRPVQEQDIESIRVWRNGQMGNLRQTEAIHVDQQKKYFEEVVFPTYGLEQPPQLLLAILSENNLIGYGGLVHINWINRTGEMSFLLDTSVGDGSSTHRELLGRFVRLIRNVAFDQLELHRLWTETYCFRTSHIEALEQSGFMLEGRLRQATKLSSNYVDSLIHSILETD